MIRRLLLIAALVIAPALPAQALSAPYETDWPANCIDNCVFPTNITSALLLDRTSVKVTMRLTCWDVSLPGFNYGLYFDTDRGAGFGTTWQIPASACDGTKHTFRKIAHTEGPGYPAAGGRALAYTAINWCSSDGTCTDHWTDEEIRDLVRVKRP